MLIEQVFPMIVGDRASLRERLEAAARDVHLADSWTRELISLLPASIIDADCFFDRLTNMWRYEYGVPRSIGDNQLLWGTHMWIPVHRLLTIVHCARTRLSDDEVRRYFERLADIDKHDDVLAEFLPVVRLLKSVPADFEHPTGVGGHNVDWRIRPPGARPVLIEVKKRMRDLFEQMDNIDTRSRVSEEPVPAPVHDTSLVFRSVEKKFPSADPEQQLHGTWISTELAQEARELVTAFNAFDPSRVHFAVLGDWDRGVKLLTRRTIDEAYLLSLFGEHHSERFTFVRT